MKKIGCLIMKTFNMYVKTVIYNEHEKILLLKQKREDKKQRWDLPGATFTEEQSFDETVINNVQKEIGYYVYPGKIIGIADYTGKSEKEVHVIMEGTILNGELLLSKDYETYTWVDISRIKDYPLVPWLHNYIQNNKYPFKDVETEIEELTNRRQRRIEVIQEDMMSSINSGDNTEKINNSVKSSFGLLKDTIKRTFHPKEAIVTQTTPKPNDLYQEQENKEEDKSNIADKLNFRFKKDEEEYLDDIVLKPSENDIFIEHEDNTEDEIIISHEDVVKEDIIIDTAKTTESIKEEPTVEKITKVEENKEISDDEKIIKPMNSEPKKVFDMNVNKQVNMKSPSDKNKEPEIKIIKKDEKTPHIRTEKESKEKFSFNSENIKRSGWKDRLNRLNRTNANDEKKEIPRPKGQRK